MLVWKITPLGEKEKGDSPQGRRLGPKGGQVLTWDEAFNQQAIFSKIIGGLSSQCAHKSIFLSLYSTYCISLTHRRSSETQRSAIRKSTHQCFSTLSSLRHVNVSSQNSQSAGSTSQNSGSGHLHISILDKVGKLQYMQ